MSVTAALTDASDALPLRVREVIPSSTNFVVSGIDWNLMVMCPVRFWTREAVLGWESSDLEDRLWDLVGQQLESIQVVHGDPVFGFSGGYKIEVFADTDIDPWVLRVPGSIVVGQIPERCHGV